MLQILRNVNSAKREDIYVFFQQLEIKTVIYNSY